MAAKALASAYAQRVERLLDLRRKALLHEARDVGVDVLARLSERLAELLNGRRSKRRRSTRGEVARHGAGNY